MTDTDRIQINEARIRAEFDELARIDSESFGEREMADRLKEKLAELGPALRAFPSSDPPSRVPRNFPSRSAPARQIQRGCGLRLSGFYLYQS